MGGWRALARTSRSPDAEAPADDAERQARQPAYVAHITVREDGMDTEQGWRTIEPGMAVTAAIKTGQRRIIEFLLSPLLRYRHDPGRER
jgi:hemolysin D